MSKLTEFATESWPKELLARLAKGESIKEIRTDYPRKTVPALYTMKGKLKKGGVKVVASTRVPEKGPIATPEEKEDHVPSATVKSKQYLIKKNIVTSLKETSNMYVDFIFGKVSVKLDKSVPSTVYVGPNTFKIE